MLPWILLTVVALAAVLWIERYSEHRYIWIAKPLASTGFIGAAVANDAFLTPYGRMVFIALVWSMLGDILLIKRDSRAAFLMGLVAFLIGHIGFAVAFSVRGVEPTWMWASMAGLALVMWVVLRWLWPHVPAAMKIPVLAYIVVITVMVAMAFGTHGVAPHGVLLTGAILFYLSDLTVARQRFVTKAYANRLVGLPLYYAGQLLFAWSITEPVL
ncbi:MAG: putative membrane protein YhhN [Myxococcota bacterium]|jgi:uncharacterized membrane protein YhhN